MLSHQPVQGQLQLSSERFQAHRNGSMSIFRNRLNISQLFDNRVPGYEADSEYFQQQQEGLYLITLLRI